MKKSCDAAEVLRQEPTSDDRRRRVHVEAFEEDERLVSRLTEGGFRREDDHKRHLYWDLGRPIPSVPTPEGYAVRPLQDADLPARGELQRAVWPWSRVDESSYPRLWSMPGYRRELDLLGIAPGGDLAAFAILWYDERNRIGEFEPVGVHPAHRGKGLGRALTIEGLRRLRDLGGDGALVYPPGGNLAACRLYESAGFELLQRQYVYSRELADLGGEA